MQSMVLTKDGINDFAPMLRDHILVDIVDNTDHGYEETAPAIPNLLRIQVDDYRPDESEEWDVDEWESRQGVIFAPATREMWATAWRMARALCKHGLVFVNGPDVHCFLPGVMVLS